VTLATDPLLHTATLGQSGLLLEVSVMSKSHCLLGGAIAAVALSSLWAAGCGANASDESTEEQSSEESSAMSGETGMRGAGGGEALEMQRHHTGHVSGSSGACSFGGRCCNEGGEHGHHHRSYGGSVACSEGDRGHDHHHRDRGYGTGY
jgi:hypothetical protein